MPEFTIHRASSLDIPAIRDMADIVFRKTYADILSPEQMEYMMDWMYSENSLLDQIESPGKAFYIAADGSGDPAGYVSIEADGQTEDGRNLYHLQKLYILPEYQHCGLGKQMMEFIKGKLSKDNPDGCRVELNVNRYNQAVGFYEHIGMHRDRQGDFPIGNGFFMNDYIYQMDI